jgi:Holliday junction DNA helicase RuvB
VDEHGLEDMDRRLLRILAQSGVPLGLKTLAAALGEAEDTIEDVFEPHLLRKGLLHKTSRGRELTAAGRELLGLDPHPPAAGGDRAQATLF